MNRIVFVVAFISIGSVTAVAQQFNVARNNIWYDAPSDTGNLWKDIKRCLGMPINTN